ncbi:MAG: FecR family protein [Dysgonomonas sp.]|jgi:ferric-dicitrate binding protein FerR (iron transport regulator)|uniref:FecR family protein n=1 Tax=unclassified Dysgonomonas TaxID=2630389 RepID=UPI0025C53E57|nr:MULTISPECIES: FecR family protein [unclassified Dysgonomonas]MDR2004304.1 FecR family protein [Prevotella sp.]HMM03180.1 FecR family protein [Dysgonomonas sp.]
MNHAHIPYDEIAGYIRQELSEQERHKIDMWINSSAENRKLFEQLLNEWENIYDSPEQSVRADKDKIWSGISSHIRTSLPVKSYTRKLLIKVAGIAAMVAIIVGVAATVFVKSTIDSAFLSQSVTTIETMQGQKMQMTLPDGTKVWLNSGSKLTYAGDFNRSERIVNLEGEAFFNVTKNQSKKFKVRTSDVDIVVKGTSFDVSAYNDDREISVSLLEGKVVITDKTGKYMTDLNPDELAIISRQNLKYTLFKDDANTYRSWTQDQLIFYNEDIYEVTKKLERWYGINIKLVNPDEKQKYTFSVKTESLRELLELFNKLTPIDYKINGKEVTIINK